MANFYYYNCLNYSYFATFSFNFLYNYFASLLIFYTVLEKFNTHHIYYFNIAVFTVIVYSLHVNKVI